jgi:hypothetical protein
MKALLICPSIRRAVPHLAENGPLATIPVLGGSVVSHWVEHLAALGAHHVRVVVADREHQVRMELGSGSRWGVRLEVVSAKIEPSPAEAAEHFHAAAATDRLPAPHDTVLMSYLPGTPELPLFESYAGWFEALLGWLPRALTPTRVRVAEIRPGVWVNRRAQIARTAELIAPCWIGDQVFVEPGAIIGPGAIVEDRAVIEGEARVVQSWVGPDTFVGPMTVVGSSLAWGSTLVNWRTDSSLHVPDPFLLCSLARPSSAALIDRFGRALAKPEHGAEPPLNWMGAWQARAGALHEFKLPNPAAER